MYLHSLSSTIFFVEYGILEIMHKDFYASGFLYHLPSNQILLQTSTAHNSPGWSLFGTEGVESEIAKVIFQNAIYEKLQVKLTLKKIHPVYMYFNTIMGKNNYIFYAEVKVKKDFLIPKGKLFSWFTFKQILKLPTTKQTGHDIMVSQRVIDAKERKRLGQHTFE